MIRRTCSTKTGASVIGLSQRGHSSALIISYWSGHWRHDRSRDFSEVMWWKQQILTAADRCVVRRWDIHSRVPCSCLRLWSLRLSVFPFLRLSVYLCPCFANLSALSRLIYTTIRRAVVRFTSEQNDSIGMPPPQPTGPRQREASRSGMRR